MPVFLCLFVILSAFLFFSSFEFFFLVFLLFSFNSFIFNFSFIFLSSLCLLFNFSILFRLRSFPCSGEQTHLQLWCGHDICGWCRTSRAPDWLSSPSSDTASRSRSPWRRWGARGRPHRRACPLLLKCTAWWKSRGKQCPPEHSAAARGREETMSQQELQILFVKLSDSCWFTKCELSECQHAWGQNTEHLEFRVCSR